MVRSEVPRRVLFNFLILPIPVFALEILSLICLLKYVCCRDAYQIILQSVQASGISSKEQDDGLFLLTYVKIRLLELVL